MRHPVSQRFVHQVANRKCNVKHAGEGIAALRQRKRRNAAFVESQLQADCREVFSRGRRQGVGSRGYGQAGVARALRRLATHGVGGNVHAVRRFVAGKRLHIQQNQILGTRAGRLDGEISAAGRLNPGVRTRLFLECLPVKDPLAVAYRVDARIAGREAHVVEITPEFRARHGLRGDK